MLNEKGVIKYTNNPFSLLTGFDPLELQNKNIKFFFNEGLPVKLKDETIPALNNQSRISTDILINHKSDGLLNLNVHVEKFIEDGSNTYFICTLNTKNNSNDLSEKINELKVLFRSLFQKTSDVLFLITTDENGLPNPFIDVNNTACHFLGYAKKELLEFSLLDLAEAECRSDIINLNDTLNAQAVCYLELSLKRKNQDIVHTRVEAQYVNHEGRQAILMIGKNISEQKELENKLSQIEKLEAVGQLAGGIAHDFNNVLAGISGLAELALRKMPEDHKAAASIKTIYQKANNTANMVRQLVAFSRKQKLSTRTIDLNSVIKANKTLLTRYLGEDITFQVLLESNPYIIKADQASLDQIITNLCINARDAMPDGGDLIVKTKNIILQNERLTVTGKMPPGKYICFTVSDTGLGMDNETIRHIFEPFYTTKDIGYGTGLGLSIVYGLIKQHNGFIDCTSKVGEGTTFDMYFPWHADSKTAEKSQQPKRDLKGNETVLIAEDEADLILYLKESLELYGYNVMIAHNGAKALEIFEQNHQKIDMIISDVVMPEMGGIELRLVAQNIKPQLKFLLISAYTNRIEPGVPFLQKPFQTEELATYVRDILDDTFVFTE
ncbi:MAG: response regulator [Calditrichae bacterium]|nr:response regulator [Calditrichota bacterium]MCB9059214.1 response regulator [Calditrichia bacterium]